MYVVIHNATGKTAEVEISGQYNRRKIIEVASEKIGEEIKIDDKENSEEEPKEPITKSKKEEKEFNIIEA